ncbi:hypothetical protein PI124_g23524 [Phytophthora idaei]|nr:hypothetical protein PI125_g25701 [Phytophthora idaei]KAG3123554.1 hypothetical protein PI126_g23650 [Phytophthora idaei]KAG3231380.1 hypothetical protein PI124_g23524 [Phytophthora idaei]
MVPAILSKSGGARNEGSSPDSQGDYDEYEDKAPALEPGAATPETATLS